MKKRVKIITIFMTIMTASTFLITGCSKEKSIPIVTINDKRLYLEDFLYDIYEVETDGNQHEAYYQENLGYSYWNYEYNGTTMREISKNSILTRVVMYEILTAEALKSGIKLSETQLADTDSTIDGIYNTSSVNTLDRIGLT